MHPHYRYGGVWKNKVGGISGKKPKAKGKGRRKKGEEGMGAKEWREGDKYTRNDRVVWGTKVWGCRRSHVARKGEEPGLKVAFWKEADEIEAGTKVMEEDEHGGSDGETSEKSASESDSASDSGSGSGSE